MGRIFSSLTSQAAARNAATAAQGVNVALSVVAPCYNEEAGLAELHSRVAAVARQLVGEDFELVLVNDGSRDGTWAGIRALCAHDPHVVGINLSRNYGHQLALSAGLSLCRGERILVVDADLQDPPELLPEMMRLMDAGADVVYGQRTDREGETWFKSRTAYLFYRLLDRLVDVDIHVDTGDFRLINRKVLDVLNAMPERHRFFRGMVSWIGLRQVPLRYRRQPRLTGRTSYGLGKMLILALDAITGFSILPLRIASLVGFFLAGFGAVALTWVLIVKAFGNSVEGWTSVMAIQIILGGAQLLVLGIFGEYLGRMFFEVKRRPLYVIDDICEGENATSAPWHEGATIVAADDLAQSPPKQYREPTPGLVEPISVPNNAS